eukprot:gb/GFBE01062135.1/.p1 GENE.gb/GFBE01062135.1/~~gb/GFBE01062135.1/.p1  ORF type:complete len:100 (+),score=1.49 gb/GFBE01062135.1/:1-300(+)
MTSGRCATGAVPRVGCGLLGESAAAGNGWSVMRGVAMSGLGAAWMGVACRGTASDTKSRGRSCSCTGSGERSCGTGGTGGVFVIAGVAEAGVAGAVNEP